MNDLAPLPTRLSFSTQNPSHQLAWDSTSLGALKTCPRYYQYNILEGYTAHAENVHFVFGIEFHAALEHYDRQRANGMDQNNATLSAVASALTSTWRPDLGRPWVSDEPTKNRHTLIRAIVWYLDQFQNDPLETVVLRNGQPAVELSFRHELELTSRSGEQYLLCGHMDKLARWEGKTWVVDRKTTKSGLGQDYFDKYSPDNQVSLYTFAGGAVFHEPVVGLIIDAGQTGVNFTRFQRQPIRRTPSQLAEWVHDLAYWLSLAESFAEAGYYPMNDKACTMYGGCPYRGVCGVAPEIRPRLLEQLYTRRAWDPLVTREI
jgi:hypothetical protein